MFQKWMNKFWQVADSKNAEKTLIAVSFSESIFFPVPPDLLLIPMGLANRQKVFRYATICLLASLLGGIIGYGIGYFFMEAVGWPIINFYGLQSKYGLIQTWYDQYSAWAVAAAGLTPIPYKLCTLTAGAFAINWPVFVIASTLSRGLRFFAIAALLYFFGEKARFFLEKRFNLFVSAAMIVVVLSFVLIKYI